MSPTIHSFSHGRAPIAIGMAGDGKEAVIAAIALADGGYPVTLHVASHDWLEALADGVLPFHAPHLQAPLYKALRSELLDVVPQAPTRWMMAASSS